MFATHLWVRAAAVMSGGAEEPSPVKAFLSPLNLLEYRDSATCSRSLGPACPGSTARGRDSPGRRPARGRPGVGTHSGSALPRYDIHYESPGVPDPRLLKSTTPVLQCSHARSASTVVTRPWWAAIHVPPLLLYYTWCGSRRTNRHQRLGHDLAFAALGKGRDVCTTPGAVRAGVPHRKHRRIAREAEIHVPVATSTRPTVGCPSN